MQQLVDHGSRAAYFRRVSEYPIWTLEAYEARRGLGWLVTLDGLVGHPPGTVAWLPYVYYAWARGRCFERPSDSVAVEVPHQRAAPGAALRYRVVQLPGVDANVNLLHTV